MSKATEAPEEESISNIANFIESTKPSGENENHEVTKSGKQTEKLTTQAKNLLTLENRNIGVHKLPVSLDPKQILSKSSQQLSQISIKPAVTKLGPGVSLSKLKPQDSSGGGASQLKLPSSISFTKMETKTPTAVTLSPVTASSASREKSLPAEVPSTLPTHVTAMTSKNAVSVSKHVEVTKAPREVSNTVPVSRLLEVTRQLEEVSPPSPLLLQHMSSEEVRNLCDGTTALHLSGETSCSDLDTLSLYRTVLNIFSLGELLQKYDREEFTPLTNLACKTNFCSNLKQLVYKEPNLRGFITNKIGEEELNKFDNLVDSHLKRGDLFVTENIELCVSLYHKIRNISLKYVLTKLRNVYIKMKPMFSSLAKTEDFDSCVTRLATLVNSGWEEEVRISEDTAYDFDFLFIILKYIKKAREQPEAGQRTEPQEQSVKKISKSVTLAPVKSKSPSDPEGSKTEDDVGRVKESALERPSVKVSVTSPVAEVKELEQSLAAAPISKITISAEKNERTEETTTHPPPSEAEKVPRPTEVSEEQTKRIVISKPPSRSFISVRSLHELKKLLEDSKESQQRVIRGVGEEAFKEFLNLVSSLQDQSLLIEDFNIRTLYFTILNFSKYPLTPAMKNLEPLSNFSLRLQPFQDLKNLFVKDVNIKKIVSEKLGAAELENFESHVKTLAVTVRDFIQKDQEKNILLYHKIRNCVAESLITRLRGIHAKIANIQLHVPAERFTISIRMLQSLMDSQFNGQVLMMEKSRFNFDFLTTILEFLQQVSPGDFSQVKKVAAPEKPRDSPWPTLIQDLKTDIQVTAVLHNVEKILSQRFCSRYVKIMNDIVDANRLNITQKRALLSLKNAVFLQQNNFNPDDPPLSLTNVSLEVSKFSALSKFINKDAGIKSVIADKHGAVTFKELEALVAAHCERGDEFVVKFVEKNVKLYHTLRNTALEKILGQITVVHSKVKNIDVPDTAKKSVQYEEAIRRLDEIVSADQVTKMALIEEQKFDFEFLSTILLVWRTVTSKPQEPQRVLAGQENPSVRPQTKLLVQQPVNINRPPAVQPRNLVPVQLVPLNQFPRQLLQRPGPSQVIQVRPAAGQLVPVRLPPAQRLAVRQDLTQVIQINESPSQPMRRQPSNQTNSKLSEEEVDDPGPASSGEPIIIVDEDIKPNNKTLVMHRRKSDQRVSSNIKPVATVTPMPPSNTNKTSQALTPEEKPARQVPQSASQTVVATVSNPMQVINGQGELPIRTKCLKCTDRSCENMEQLIHHYSVCHFRDQLEADYVRSEKCPGCPEVFKEKTDLIKHIGYIHGTVQLVLTKTERWICNYCKKEFLTNDFLKKHLIKTHLEKKFESTFLALSENDEILCQFCDKTFSHKKNLFCHIGIDHHKLEELLTEDKKEAQSDTKCRHCDLEASLPALKSHYVSTHYRDTFHAYCSELGLLGEDKSCKFCLITFEEESGLLEHLGLEHNLIYRLIANFHGKVVSATYRTSQPLKALSEMLEKKMTSETNPEPAQSTEPEPEDPLLTETVFVDTSKEIISPVKSVIKIISPSKLMMQPKNNNETTQEKQKAPKLKTSLPEEAPAPKKARILADHSTNPLFQEYKTFCIRSSGNPKVMKLLQTGFTGFDASVFESYLEGFCGNKTNIPKVEELLDVFSKVYPEESVHKLPSVLKFLSLAEYPKYCGSVRTTPEQCHPMQLVIFLSQVLAKPGLTLTDLPWIIQKISLIHNKVDGEPITKNKKIRDFFEAIDQPLEDDEIVEVEPDVNLKVGRKSSESVEVETSKSLSQEKENSKDDSPVKVIEKDDASPVKVIEKDDAEMSPVKSKEVQQKSLTTADNIQPAAERGETSPGSVSTRESDPSVEVERTKMSPLAGTDPATSVKVEKPESPPSQERNVTAEPEVIELDDEEEEGPGLEYKYFCLECEGCAGNARCDHTDHPRVPVPFDLRSHFKTTGHVAVSPMRDFASMKKISDIAYSFTYGASVRKQWKDLVLAGSHKPTPFSGVKKCKWNNCNEIFEDAVDAFKHIRDSHLKSAQTKQKKRKSETILVQPAAKSSKL